MPEIKVEVFLFLFLIFAGFEELVNISHRRRHFTDVSSVTGGSSINGQDLHVGHEETDGYDIASKGISSNLILQPVNTNWFRSEIIRLKFGKSVLSLNKIRNLKKNLLNLVIVPLYDKE